MLRFWRDCFVNELSLRSKANQCYEVYMGRIPGRLAAELMERHHLAQGLYNSENYITATLSFIGIKCLFLKRSNFSELYMDS